MLTGPSCKAPDRRLGAPGDPAGVPTSHAACLRGQAYASRMLGDVLQRCEVGRPSVIRQANGQRAREATAVFTASLKLGAGYGDDDTVNAQVELAKTSA